MNLGKAEPVSKENMPKINYVVLMEKGNEGCVCLKHDKELSNMLVQRNMKTSQNY